MTLPATRRQARVAGEAVLIAALTTATVTAAALLVPERLVATIVGFLFLAVTWLTVWRQDDARVEASGLALGGLVLPGKLPLRRMLSSTALAVAWALGTALIVFVPFYFGWRRFWHASGDFQIHLTPLNLVNEAFGQLVIIAVPEEAFYRGYLQSRLDEAFEPRWKVLGARVGPALLLTSALFALGHFATIHAPARLAVFFPSLLFGWLRARTRGIGAGCVFHAMCNMFSELLGKGFGVY